MSTVVASFTVPAPSCTTAGRAIASVAVAARSSVSAAFVVTGCFEHSSPMAT